MRAAGIRDFNAAVELLDLQEPRELRADEVLIEVHGCGVGNWDDIARAGGWDLGRQPPMALGVEAAGVVTAVGTAVDSPALGDRVMTHSLPLRAQGAWAERFVSAAADVAVIPQSVPLDVAAAAPVPVLTADQALDDALGTTSGATLLVHGASGVTGMVIVQLATYLGANVIATASQRSAGRVSSAGAAHVLDYRSPDWPGQVRALTGGLGADLAVNAAPGAAAIAITAVRDGGRLATLTSDPPARERGIDIRQVYVAPDGPRLVRLAGLLATGTIAVVVGGRYSLPDAAAALERVLRGTGGEAVILEPGAAQPQAASW